MDDEDGLLITEYIQAVSDYEIMKQFKENKIGQRRIRYIDKVYSRKNIPLDDQLSYLESVATKVGKIDRSVCEYAMGLSDDPQRILQAYDDIFYSQNAVERIKYVLFWQRDDLTKELMKGKTRDENEFDMLKGRLSSFKEEIQRMIYSLEMRRLVPVIHHQMWDNLMIIKDDKYYFALNSTQISGEDINTIFAIPDELVNLFESLAYYSKKIVSDTIEGKTPLMYWENSVAEKESVSIQEAVERCSI